MNIRTHKLMQCAVLSFVLAVVPGISAAATAVSMIGENTVKVSFADLDLSKPAGAKALYQRLRIAADKACGLQVGLREVIDVTNMKQTCAETALVDAVRNIDNDLLNKLHLNGKNS